MTTIAMESNYSEMALIYFWGKNRALDNTYMTSSSLDMSIFSCFMFQIYNMCVHLQPIQCFYCIFVLQFRDPLELRSKRSDWRQQLSISSILQTGWKTLGHVVVRLKDVFRIYNAGSCIPPVPVQHYFNNQPVLTCLPVSMFWMATTSGMQHFASCRWGISMF